MVNGERLFVDVQGLHWDLPDQPQVSVEPVFVGELRPGGGRYRVVRVQCGKRWVDVTISPQGRSLRAHLTDHAQMRGQTAEMTPGEWHET